MGKIKYHKKKKIKQITYYLLYKIKEEEKNKFRIYVAINSKPEPTKKIKIKNLPDKVQKIYFNMTKLIEVQFKRTKKVKGLPKDVYSWIKSLKKLSKLL